MRIRRTNGVMAGMRYAPNAVRFPLTSRRRAIALAWRRIRAAALQIMIVATMLIAADLAGVRAIFWLIRG